MRTLIKPTVTLQNSSKDGLYRVTAILCKKTPNELTVKAKSHNGKDNRIYGTIHRNGIFTPRKTIYARNSSVLVANKRKQIDTVLDLVFGTKRDKFPVLNEFGQTEFVK